MPTQSISAHSKSDAAWNGRPVHIEPKLFLDLILQINFTLTYILGSNSIESLSHSLIMHGWGALSHQRRDQEQCSAVVPVPWLNFHKGMCAVRQSWRTGTSHLLHTYRMSSSMLAPLTHIRANREELCT